MIISKSEGKKWVLKESLPLIEKHRESGRFYFLSLSLSLSFFQRLGNGRMVEIGCPKSISMSEKRS